MKRNEPLLKLYRQPEVPGNGDVKHEYTAKHSPEQIKQEKREFDDRPKEESISVKPPPLEH